MSQLRIYEAYLDVTYVTIPVVDPTAPTGVVTTNLPAAAWTNTLDADGGAQTSYWVRYFNAAQYGAVGFDPATSTPVSESSLTAGSATSWQPSVPVLNGGTYRAYVRVGQTVNSTEHYSAWAYEAFTVSVSLPGVPTLLLTPEATDGRIQIDVTHNTGAATTDALQIQRSIDNLTWTPLRLTVDTDGIVAGLDTTVYDLEGGNGQTVYYRARALHNYSGLYAASEWATGNSVWTSTEWWLKSVQHPSLNMPIVVHSLPSYQRPARQGIFQALGATDAIVISDTRGADRGTIVLRVDTDAEGAALDDLIDYGGVLLLQGAPNEHWTDRYVVLGDLDRGRLVDKAFVEGTLDTFAWTQVSAPVGVIDDWPDVGS